MARATCYFFDANVGRTLNHADAIVAGGDLGSCYLHQVGSANMDPVGVWAVSGRDDAKVV